MNKRKWRKIYIDINEKRLKMDDDYLVLRKEEMKANIKKLLSESRRLDGITNKEFLDFTEKIIESTILKTRTEDLEKFNKKLENINAKMAKVLEESEK